MTKPITESREIYRRLIIHFNIRLKERDMLICRKFRYMEIRDDMLRCFISLIGKEDVG